MENPYVKQFPDLMVGKKILYVHGFASSAQSGTVSRLRTVFPNAKVLAYDLPVHPEEALSLLYKVCQEEKPDLILGTSMGGMYTEQLYGFDRICINPAFKIADTMQEHGLTGKQQFQNPRQDGVQEFYVDKQMVKEYRAATEQNFAHASDEGEHQRVFGLFGDKDELVHTRDLFCSHYTQNIPFHGEHRMNDQSFLHSVMPVIRWIDDRQEKRQRPIVYIGLEGLTGLTGLTPRPLRGESLTPRPLQRERELKPLPSAQKAIRHLIEKYEVFFVAPPVEYAATESWLTEYVGVPAWHHTIFTARPDLLYGDYFIAQSSKLNAQSSKLNAFATTIEFGSDTFKTWDDIIEYFDRLGGQ
jgi:predicted esterase YcpF (UPF0227 family)